MTLCVFMLAVTLAAGNAEFEASARTGAQTIARARLADEMVRTALVTGCLQKAMLANPASFAGKKDAEARCRDVYREALAQAYRTRAREIDERLGLKAGDDAPRADLLRAAAEAHFAEAFVRERAAAVAAQSATLVCTIRPTEADVESMDESTLARTMSARVAAQQKTAVFEENVAYISEAIVTPVLASAKSERERQRQYLLRATCDGYAPAVVEGELKAKLARNVAERKAKATDPASVWGVFPGVLSKTLPEAVQRRVLDRVVRQVDDVPVAIDAAVLAQEIEGNRAAHRRAVDSEKIFRRTFASKTLTGAIAAAEREAPSAERKAFADYVRNHAKSGTLARAVDARVKRELLPRLSDVRASYAAHESRRLWPAFEEARYFPSAELADETVAKSDYAHRVRDWRTMAELAPAVLIELKAEPLEETSARADVAVADAFARARSAIAAQNEILTAVEPEILAEALARQASFWRRTPDFAKVVELLTEAVEAQWRQTKVDTLWPDGNAPANAAEQHAGIFPSVRKRIELIARTILEEMAKDETPPEEKPEEPVLQFSIVVQRQGDAVKVRLEQDGKTVVEKKPKAERAAFGAAMKAVSDKLGKDILKLQ